MKRHSAGFFIGIVVSIIVGFAVVVVVWFGLGSIQGLGYSPAAAGFAFLPLPVALGIANVAAGPIGHRFGSRIPMASGLLVGAIGYCLLAQLGTATSYFGLLPGLVVVPMGVGLAVPLMTSALLSTVPPTRAGVASGVLNTVRQAGGAIGVALFGAMVGGHGVAGLRLALMLSAGLCGGAAVIAATRVHRRVAGRCNTGRRVMN